MSKQNTMRLKPHFTFVHVSGGEKTYKISSYKEHKKLFTTVWLDFLKLKVKSLLRSCKHKPDVLSLSSIGGFFLYFHMGKSS